MEVKFAAVSTKFAPNGRPLDVLQAPIRILREPLTAANSAARFHPPPSFSRTLSGVAPASPSPNGWRIAEDKARAEFVAQATDTIARGQRRAPHGGVSVITAEGDTSCSASATGSKAVAAAYAAAAAGSRRATDNSKPHDGGEQPGTAKPGAATARPSPFRVQALRAKTEESRAQPLPEISGGSWVVLTVVSGLLVVAAILAYLGRVEETSTAGGVLLVRGGPRPVVAQVSGSVTAIDVKPGEVVEAGRSIAQIDTTELNARVQRDGEQLALVEAELARLSPINSQRYQNELQLLQRKRDLLSQRAELKAIAVRDREIQTKNVEHAALAGVASQADALGAREAARAATEELLLIRQQIIEVELLLSADKKTFASEQDRLRRELKEAQSNFAQSRSMLEMTAVRAPVSGRVESLLATQGQVINAGTVMARIIPDGSVTSAVCFAPVKDAAFLRPGLEANVEFVSFPVSEFGRTPGRVVRVSPDVASNQETEALLGHAPDEPVIRVEIELLPGAKLLDVQDKLRSGERLTVRLTTRERRLIALVFDFLRKWYDP